MDHGSQYILWKLWPTAFRLQFPKCISQSFIPKCIFASSKLCKLFSMEGNLIVLAKDFYCKDLCLKQNKTFDRFISPICQKWLSKEKPSVWANNKTPIQDCLISANIFIFCLKKDFDFKFALLRFWLATRERKTCVRRQQRGQLNAKISGSPANSNIQCFLCKN